MQEMIVYYGVLYLVPLYSLTRKAKNRIKFEIFGCPNVKKGREVPQNCKNHPDYDYNRGKIFMLFKSNPKNSISPCSHIFSFCTGVLLLRRRYKKSLGRE